MCSQNHIYDVEIEPDVLYQVERLKDDYEELEENYKLVQKELKSRSRQFDALKRNLNDLEQKHQLQREQFELRFKSQEEDNSKLVTNIQDLEEELEKHKQQLDEAKFELLDKKATVTDETISAREINKQTREYMYKWKLAEQENSVLQTSVNRLESQVARYKESLKDSETIESDLKAEKRKLLRELRESQAKVEELETNNSHLQKRLDRMRSRNMLLNGDTTPTTDRFNTITNTEK